MMTTVNSASLKGFDPFLVRVEVTATRGVPKLIITGLADRAVSESKHRILTALKNLGIELKSCRIVVNLAPADVNKRGAHLDLPIALAVLSEFGHCSLDTDKTLMVGELGLNGEIKPVKGVFNYVLFARNRGFERVIIPQNQEKGLGLISGIEILLAKNLAQVINWTKNRVKLPSFKAVEGGFSKKDLNKFDHFWGQLGNQPKIQRALAISAVGGHHLLLLGPIDASKNSVAQAMRAVLPPPTSCEAIEALKIHSLMNGSCHHLVSHRPWREVDMNVTKAGLVGGGRRIRPGEVSLAHQGVLYIKHISRISYKILSCLEQPLTTGRIKLRRNNVSFGYSADFCLIGSSSLCPCGYFGSKMQSCTCNPNQRKRFLTKIPPFLFRQIDLYLKLQPFGARDLSQLFSNQTQPGLKELRRKVERARQVQLTRYKQEDFKLNYQLSSNYIQSKIRMSQPAKKALEEAYQSLQLSSTVCLKTIKIAQSIADLEQVEEITVNQINEALGYRFSFN